MSSPPATTPHRVPVTGMHCAGCATTVQRLLASTPGVDAVDVSFGTESAEVRGSVSIGALRDALLSGGYDLATRETTLHGLGSERLPDVQGVDGVLEADVTEAGVVVRHIDHPDVLDALRGLLADTASGWIETERDPTAARRAVEVGAWRRRFLGALGPTLLLLLFSMVWKEALGPDRVVWLALLALPVQLGFGWPFLAGAWRALRSRSADMNTLVALGTLSAYGYSLHVGLRDPTAAVYFDTSATIITLVCLGRWLEARARASTGDAVSALAGLEPERAWLLAADGSETSVPVARLLAGDRVRVKPGERVPSDGAVDDGRSHVDESMLTGESDPVGKAAGDPVTGGTQNLEGALDVTLTAVGPDTTLRRIVEWVRSAQSGKAPVARMADRVAAVFVPVVLGIAVLTFVAWALLADDGVARGLVASVAVLLIACPCALGLATPTAIVVGTGRAAREGILFKGGAVIERAAALTQVVFDKTGTLTHGRPEIVEIVAWRSNDDALLSRVASAEARSEHPVAGAVLRAAAARGLELPDATEFIARPGLGIEALVERKRVLVGNLAWMETIDLGVDDFGPVLERADAAGATPLLVAIDGIPRGGLLVRDPARQDATDAVAGVRALGLDPAMLSGDREAVAAKVGREVGIDDVEAEVGPLEKAAVVRRRQQTGAVVAMVGDGVNDAPALAQADVGIAVSSGTHVATSAADVALARPPDLRLVPEAVYVAQKTLATIRRNLFFAFVYNALGIPLAALGLLHPMLAAGAMAFSSVSVVLSSLRLRSLPRYPGPPA